MDVLDLSQCAWQIIAARFLLLPHFEVKKFNTQAMSDWSIQAGSRVLVHAGSSGVGTWVVQIAKVCNHALLLFLDMQHVPCSAYGGTNMKQAQNSSVIALRFATSLPYVIAICKVNYQPSASYMACHTILCCDQCLGVA